MGKTWKSMKGSVGSQDHENLEVWSRKSVRESFKGNYIKIKLVSGTASN